MSKRISHILRHYQFRQRLAYKCACYGISFKIVNEAYTTKTCSICGHNNNHITNDNIIICAGCGIVIDRDTGGSRGIAIKAIYL